MKPIDVKILKKFLKIAGIELSGEWVLMGGTVLPLLGVDYRTTVDIDFVSVSGKDQNLKLMEVAEKLGLPVEAINQAGAYFLRKIPDYRKHLIVLYKGENSTIYRPDLELYIRLKINRMSEIDLHDCLEYLKYIQHKDETFNKKDIIKHINSTIKATDSKDEKQRLTKLLEQIAIVT